MAESNTPIEIVDTPGPEGQRPGSLSPRDVATLSSLKNQYRLQLDSRIFAQAQMVHADLEMDMIRLRAFEMLRAAGLSWELIMEEIRQWH